MNLNKISFDCLKKEYIDSLYTLYNMCNNLHWSKSVFEADLKNSNARYMLAFYNGTLIAYCIYYCVLNEAEIINISVHPNYRQLGIGGNLLQKLNEICIDLNIVTINLEVRENNINAINLYNKNGFKIVGCRKNYYPDNKENAILMTKYIKEV